MDADAWNERYAAEPVMWGSSPNPTVVDAVGTTSPGYAIDLACGDGRHASWLASKGWLVDAVDFSTTAIDQASKRPDTAHEQISWQVGDAYTWAPRHAANLVLVAYLHLPDLIEVLARAAKWLAPGGRLIYLGHAYENVELGVGGPSDPEVLPTIGTLAAVAPGFRVEHLAHLDRETAAGIAIDMLLVASRWGTSAAG